MTSAIVTTEPLFIDEEDDNVNATHPGIFRGVAGRREVSGRYLDTVRNDTQTAEPSTGYYVCPKTAETTYREVKFIQYGEDRDAFVVVDFLEPVAEFPEDHQEAVQYLRDNGRPVLADKLFAMLKSVDEDPDGPTVRVASMRDMARLLVEYGCFADPSISPDRYGTVHGQWRIVGDGLLVVSFLGCGEILFIAQADETAGQEELDISQHGLALDILGEYGHLVPLRN